MKTLTTLIAGMALTTASAVVNAAEVEPTPAFIPFAPFAMTEAQQASIAEHQKLIAEQQRAFAEQQATAIRNAMETHRLFIEQSAAAPRAPAPCVVPVTPFPPVALPEAPAAAAPFELSELPAVPSIAGLDPRSRRTEMRNFTEERREAMRKRMQEHRDAALQERDKYLKHTGRFFPGV